MKKLIVLFCLAISSTFAQPAVDNVNLSPFKKDAKVLINSHTSKISVLEGISGATAYNAPGLLSKRVARAEYDVAVDGGTIAAHTLGVTLPVNSIITRSWIAIVTQFVDAGAGTVALHCEDANNIKTATDITGSAAGALIEGESTGATSAMKTSIGAACLITATVAGAAQSAGKLVVFVEYVTTE